MGRVGTSTGKEHLLPSRVILSTRVLICTERDACWSNFSLDLRMSWHMRVHSSISSLFPSPLSRGRGRLRDILSDLAG